MFLLPFFYYKPGIACCAESGHAKVGLPHWGGICSPSIGRVLRGLLGLLPLQRVHYHLLSLYELPDCRFSQKPWSMQCGAWGEDCRLGTRLSSVALQCQKQSRYFLVGISSIYPPDRVLLLRRGYSTREDVRRLHRRRNWLRELLLGKSKPL